jgi:hypothetical protein
MAAPLSPPGPYLYSYPYSHDASGTYGFVGHGHDPVRRHRFGRYRFGVGLTCEEAIAVSATPHLAKIFA